ncbi:flagellar hook-length control protein FliK [Pseudoalteromonas sp. DL2-H2.2]|uniref:flagellar hook-length control protein FliK n=1 Tax=Pseudoalteromonas sp. DL2-H2.2 TaxID=2908889 RepID=UPI001F1EB273|nr:flagellar hook-length control protein FliK [Pseudoalteromonas sp. DL2-H2.2]MCF2909755.1 flagellar hook-length control protein FliK [Pseudoalteromonas sp. DL2-H2.2]
MVNVSLEVAINNGVSAKGKDQTEQSEDSGFLAMLAQAEQDSSDEAQQSDTDETQEYTPLPGGLDRRLGLDTSDVPTNKKAAPDEPLKLDDSELPGQTVGQSGAAAGSNSDADDLLAQITSSNAQSTDVAHNLAPVPKALKDYLGKEALVTPPEGKQPGDNIGPVVPAPAGQGDEALDPEIADTKAPLASATSHAVAKPMEGKTLAESVDEQVITKRVERVGPVITQPSEAALPAQADNQPVKGEAKAAGLTEALKSGSTGDIKHAVNITSTDEQKHAVQTKPLQAEQALPAGKPATSEVPPVTVNPAGDKEAVPREQASAQSAAHKYAGEAQPLTGKVTQRSGEQIGPVITTPQGDEAQGASADKASKTPQPAQPQQISNATSTSDLKGMVDALTPQQKQTLATNLQSQLDSGELSDPEHRAKAEQLLQELGVKPQLAGANKAQDMAATVAKQPAQTDQQVQNNNTEQLATSEKDSKAAKVTDPVSPDKVNKQSAAVSQSAVGNAEQKSQLKDVQQQAVASESLDSEHPELAQLKKEGGQSEQQNSQQRSAVPAPIENIFKAIRGERVDDGLKHEFNEVLAQVEQVRQTQQVNQQSAVNQKAMQTDPAVSQAINIARNDAVKALQERVNMMLNINNKEAEIRLDPPELGSMQIRIRSEGEQAQVNFVVQNQQAKEQLEQSMPKLREMLAEQGIQLGESNIQQGQGGEQQQQESSQGHGTLANNGSEAQNNGQQSTTSRRQSDSAIDYYA